MIISKNSWIRKEPSENWSLRLQRISYYLVSSQYKVKLGYLFHILGKYKAIVALAFLLIFQFSLYDYNYTEYVNLILLEI
ncbi:hypothetical protein Megvenef_01533 [Candidatus Megaera venefica]|uniref:Uncharacterized protein n=1 Tax=Candidatus Megaera venefica TaxID=2055910 RepID=A0ABU5NEE6_9RICK|nr:hypothetical protein [Candidatus Megaera venefica]